jgi:hypothetical protein
MGLNMEAMNDISVNEINQGFLHVTRIHNIIERIEYLHSVGYVKGMPTIRLEFDELLNWYSEIYAVLKPQEKKHSKEYFLDFFFKYPIVAGTNGYFIPAETEKRMFEFRLWLFEMMYTRGLLTKVGVGGHVEY